MLKTGISSLAQLRRGASLTSLMGIQRKVSVTLYDQIGDEPNAESLAEHILLLFADERGAYKRTYARRFEAFDDHVSGLVRERFPAGEALVVQDVAVSDARTAVDFFMKLEEHYPGLAFHASDHGSTVHVVEEGRTKVTFGPSGKVLEVVWPPFVFNTTRRENPAYYPVNYVARALVDRLVVRGLERRYRAGEIASRPIFCCAPSALALSRRDPRFRLGQHDLLKPFERTSHVVRAMNVLNQSYFSKPEQEAIVGHLRAALLPGGLLAVGSNQDAGSPVHGGVYERTEQGFAKLWQSGTGPSIEGVLLGTPA